MADVVAPLSEDERAVLMIAAEGMPMIPIGRWEDAVRNLARRGFLKARDSVNYVITPAGRAAIDAVETQAVRDVIEAQNRVARR